MDEDANAVIEDDYDPFDDAWKKSITAHVCKATGRRHNAQGKALNCSKGARQKRSAVRTIRRMATKLEAWMAKHQDDGTDEAAVAKCKKDIKDLQRIHEGL